MTESSIILYYIIGYFADKIVRGSSKPTTAPNLKGNHIMEKIFSGDILNITSFKKGFVLAVKVPTDNNEFMVRFYGYDAVNDNFTAIRKSVYMKIKFGYEYEEIVKTLGDYVSCDVGFLPDGKVMAIYSNGEYNIFNSDGSVSVSSQLSYHGSSVCDIAVDGQYIWCAVPDENAVIKYSPREGRVALRVGGGESTAFERPGSVTLSGKTLYICNLSSRKIRILNTQTNSVNDFRLFDKKVFKYITVFEHEFVWLQDGLYVLD